MLLAMSDVHATLLWVALGVIFAAVGTTGAMYATIIRPAHNEHEKHEKERAEVRRKSDAFMFGVEPIDGVIDGALSAPRRLQSVEQGLKVVTVGLSKNTNAVVQMADRMDKFNGSVGRIESMATSLMDTSLTTVRAQEIADDSVAVARNLAHVTEKTAADLAQVTDTQHQEVIEAVTSEHTTG